MTITEIIKGIEHIQHDQEIKSGSGDIERLCILSKHLALHVQQLEVEMKNHSHSVIRLTEPV